MNGLNDDPGWRGEVLDIHRPKNRRIEIVCAAHQRLDLAVCGSSATTAALLTLSF